MSYQVKKYMSEEIATVEVGASAAEATKLMAGKLVS
jgi:hypothetical protein